MYRTKELAELHLNLKLVLRYCPTVLTKCLKHGGKDVAKMIRPSNFFQRLQKNRSKEKKLQLSTKHPIIEGWICMFAADGKVYGIEAEKMTFNEFGKYKSTKESKKHLFLLC
jgi:hypothetical protein